MRGTQRAITLIAAALALAACATVPPSPPDAAVQQGIDQLKSHRYEAALAVFHAADGPTPNPLAVFYEGVTLNRLGRFAAARQRLDHATAMGLRHPELAFESGWSLLGLRRWDEAIGRL